MKCSVIICSHNPRENYLQRVLDSLRAQTLPQSEWEILLIDNASQIPLSKRFELGWHSAARHIVETELGLTPARLRGIRESRSEVLVFVDDDTVLAPDYLAQTVVIGSEWPFIGMWGGSCCPEFETPLPTWVGNQSWRLTVVEVKEDVWSNLRDGFATFPPGAGMCVRKTVCQRFLERCQNEKNRTLGRRGTGLSGYEDAEMAQCAIDLGLGTGRSRRLRLTHLIPASRLTIDYFVRHAEGDAASLVVYRALRNLPIQEPKPPTPFGRFRWFLSRLINRIPHEQYLIQKAHERGLRRGFELVQNMRR